ncbi:MAG: multidrug effflux MFS transporter [Schwartzia sp. (in: firmicutes)]
MVFLGMLAALAPLATDMYLPALPLMTAAFGVGASAVQLSLTMTMAGMAIGPLFAGPVSDHWGRKRPLLLGMTLFSLSTVGCVMSDGITAFLAFRFLQGFTGAFGLVTARAVARDLYEGVELTRFFSLLMLVNGLAPILSAMIGGQILLVASWRGVFVLLAILGVLLSLTSVIAPETLPKAARIDKMTESFQTFGHLMRDAYFRGQCLVQFFFFAAFFAYIAGSPFLFQNIYGISPQIYGFIFGGIGVAVSLAGVLPVRLAGRVPDHKVLAWTLFQSIGGSILFLIACYTNAALPLVILSLLTVIPLVSVLGAVSFSLAMKAQGDRAGSASALLGFFSMVAGGLAAPIVGIAGEENALPMAGLMLIGCLAAYASYRLYIAPAHRTER